MWKSNLELYYSLLCQLYNNESTTSVNPPIAEVNLFCLEAGVATETFKKNGKDNSAGQKIIGHSKLKLS